MDRDGTEYTTDRAPTETEPLDQVLRPLGPLDARAAAIEVAVTRDTDAGVRAYISEGNRYRDHVTLMPRTGLGRRALDGPRTCNAWAYQVAELLISVGSRSHIDRIDLYLACPVELAVAVGWWANASGPLQLMNWLAGSGPYQPMWHLP
jgi:hypothetical protein